MEAIITPSALDLEPSMKMENTRINACIEADTTNCWVTLLTKPSYLPGVIILAYTLDVVQSKYPLVVQYTRSLGEEGILALEAECLASGRIILAPVDLLVPRVGQENVGIVAERFRDTFTKLRAFEVYKLGYTKACYLDADMAVFTNPDTIFDTQLPDQSWIAANHACVCNLDNDKWAPSFWHKGNCAYTTLRSPDQVFGNVSDGCRPSYRLLNGGMFLFHPSMELWQGILREFHRSNKLKHYQFPDQEFLADFFWNKWQPLSWKYNALKTMRYWHPDLWSDDKAAIIHYIVDKPWEREVSPTGLAGHLGRDGETHKRWWISYRRWKMDRLDDDGAVDVIAKLVGTQKPQSFYRPLASNPGTLEDVANASTNDRLD